jgi:hypothetical protein
MIQSYTETQHENVLLHPMNEILKLFGNVATNENSNSVLTTPGREVSTAVAVAVRKILLLFFLLQTVPNRTP